MKQAFDRVSSNGRLHTLNHVPALLMSIETREQLALLREAPEMRYMQFSYAPEPKVTKVPALLAPVEPQFPTISGRMAWCNGKFVSCSDTSVTYRRGRRVVTEWHALAAVHQH